MPQIQLNSQKNNYFHYSNLSYKHFSTELWNSNFTKPILAPVKVLSAIAIKIPFSSRILFSPALFDYKRYIDKNTIFELEIQWSF